MDNKKTLFELIFEEDIKATDTILSVTDKP